MPGDKAGSAAAVGDRTGVLLGLEQVWYLLRLVGPDTRDGGLGDEVVQPGAGPDIGVRLPSVAAGGGAMEDLGLLAVGQLELVVGQRDALAAGPLIDEEADLGGPPRLTWKASMTFA